MDVHSELRKKITACEATIVRLEAALKAERRQAQSQIEAMRLVSQQRADALKAVVARLCSVSLPVAVMNQCKGVQLIWRKDDDVRMNDAVGDVSLYHEIWLWVDELTYVNRACMNTAMR